ncbi:hypothetical protein [Mycobacterium uberis]|uniref:hypothetical protein n=1 Tax=Mycobacterium uberis TaxID=2162698 RepID=UPI001FB362D7|nr:hypothetical protein [Mycobacterium uberis]
MHALLLRTHRHRWATTGGAVVSTLGTWMWIGVTNDPDSQLDCRLDSVSSLGDIGTSFDGVQQTISVGSHRTST